MENYAEINYNKNMDMLFEALKYCEQCFSHDDIIEELKNDNNLKKQLCIIELQKVNNQKEADILVGNLTGKSGPVRETASYKILELIKKTEFKSFFQTKEISSIFVKAITDINPSVSRNAVEIIKYVDNYNYIYLLIIKEINKTLSEINEIKQIHSYTANKKNFNLYWNLEAIVSISDRIKAGKELYDILNITALSNDYTIREKTAKVSVAISKYNHIFCDINNILQNDENIYVRKYF